jgi:hypothetical protein
MKLTNEQLSEIQQMFMNFEYKFPKNITFFRKEYHRLIRKIDK